MTISLEKQYRTCDGREVRIYASDGGTPNSFHGAIKMDYGWDVSSWDDNGASHVHPNYNLIETKPRIQREFWVNVYERYLDGNFPTKERADNYAHERRIACVKIIIDCEEGEGL